VAGGEAIEGEGSWDNNIGGGDMGDKCQEVRGRRRKGEGQVEW
jgi:hypothetical protein